ncbi:MAG: hypothetical protein WCJ30_05810 [Deltaproteobacteria bacterium]
MRRDAWKRLASLLVAMLAATGCRRSEVHARCTVRTAGSYCTFQNTGTPAARACFAVTVGPPRGFVAYASARVCSPVLQPGERSAAVPIAFEDGDPLARCGASPGSGGPGTCETRVTTERIEPAP